MKKKQKMALYGLTPVLVGLAFAGSASADTISTTTSSAVKGIKGKMHKGAGAQNDTALASILGITSTELTTALSSGKTIDTLIAEKGLDKNAVMQKLRAAHEAKMQAQIAADIASGKITKAEATKMKADHTAREIKHKETLAIALGISVASLEAEMQSGKTMDQLATAHGLTVDALKTKLDTARQAQMKTDLAERVASGKLTQTQANSILAHKEKNGRAGEFGPRGGHKLDQNTLQQ